MSASFYFYDLETSGINPRNSRVMQFGGQRTDLNLEPIGNPDNFLIKLTPDILPDPEAVLITGITPQQTLAEGIGEAEFLQYFHKNIALADTIFVGFNSIRFDDEFIRFLNYRNFYDAYEWQWQDGKSRWDMLDVVRMTRALRPDGITWPVSSEGKTSNRLEHLATANNFIHEQVHDALSDVNATITLAKLIRQRQPKLFDYLLKMRDKKEVEKLVSWPEPFIYSSGRYSGVFENTTIAVTVANHPTQKGAVFVYDLRYDPKPFAKLKPAKLAELLKKYKLAEGEEYLPVKQLQFNRCPAVAPLSVLDKTSLERLKINMDEITANAKTLLASGDFSDNLQEAIAMNEKQKQASFIVDVKDVDSQLYDGFFGDDDKNLMRIVRTADKNGLADLHPEFKDSRLDKLLFLYKARQFPKSLNQDEQAQWQKYLSDKLSSGNNQSTMAKYFAHISELASKGDLSPPQEFLLEELKLYGESIMPYDA